MLQGRALFVLLILLYDDATTLSKILTYTEITEANPTGLPYILHTPLDSS